MFDALVARSQKLIAAAEVFVPLTEQAFVRAALSRLSGTGRKSISDGSLTFLSGPEGIGKSFLARRAIREIRRRQPKLLFLIASAEELSELLFAAVDQQNLADVLELFDDLNVIVCDDLQALEGQTDRQELLMELIDGLCRNATHVLITSRKLPGELRDFSPRWTSRCHGGLCAALPALGRDSRIELISRFVQVRHLPFVEPVGPSIEWLADRWTVSPAQIVGFLNRLGTSCHQRSGVIDISFLERWQAEETPAQILTLDAIAAIVASEFGISTQELKSRSRQPSLIVPRQCAMFLAREFTGRPLEFIGQYFGDRTHTTVSHSLSRLKALLPNAPTLRQQVQRLRKRLMESRREDCA